MTDNRKRIQQSIDYIESNLCEDIRPNKLAHTAYLSKFHFHRLFRGAVGETVMKYIQKRRLAEAAKDLSRSKDKIAQIALRYQFGSQESFSRAFKRMYGVSPKEFRNGELAVVFYEKAVVILNSSQDQVSGKQPVCLAA